MREIKIGDYVKVTFRGIDVGTIAKVIYISEGIYTLDYEPFPNNPYARHYAKLEMLTLLPSLTQNYYKVVYG